MKRLRVPVALVGHVVVLVVFATFILGGGIPAVRHDWLFPAERAAFVQRMFDLALGWNPEGLGAPYPYPMTYWVTLPLAALGALAGPLVALGALVGAIGIGAALVARRIAMFAELPVLIEPVIGALLLFNPWVYSKIVAGHLTQTLAYLGLAVVIIEVFRREPSRLVLAFAVAVSALQTQFFFVALVCCMLRLRSAAARYAIFLGLIVYLPSLIGILLDRNALLAWPFTIAWEDQQSVPIKSGVLLLGYFTRYADHAFGGVPMTVALTALAVLALLAVVRERRSATWALAASIVLTLVFCSGTIGPIGPLWRWAILHVPEIGVYRELYDLIAICTIGYIVLAAFSFARWPYLRFAGLILACAFVVAWIAVPPSTLWVWQSTISPAPAAVKTVARYALMPPFQPLSYNGHGEGVDPLYVGISPMNAPINALLPPTYPAETALARYALGGDARELAALGVGLVLCRNGFAETPATRAFYLLPSRLATCTTREIAPAPIMSFASTWSECSVCASPTAGNIFFADLRGGALAIPAQREFADPRQGWIDTRLAFAANPGLGQPFGGAYTEQSRAPLTIPRGAYILVNVHGHLVDSGGTIIADDSQGYRWVALHEQTDAVRCFGRCAVALASTTAPGNGADPQQSGIALTFTRPATFVAFVTVPKSAGVLRFSESFDPSWTAIDLDTRQRLEHVRLDGTFNAWMVHAATAPSHMMLIEMTALLQAVAVIPGFVAIAFILFQWARQGWPSRSREERLT